MKEVKPPDFVRAIVRTIASADTAVIDLQVQSFTIVQRRLDWTDHFTWSIFTMHARHRNVNEARVGGGAFVIGVNPNPQHVAAARDLIFPYDGNVILGFA